MGVDCCAYGSVGKALGIVRPMNWLPILGTTGRVVVGVKLDSLEGRLSELGGGEAESAGSSIPVRCWDYPTISRSSSASLFRGSLLDIVAAGGTYEWTSGGGERKNTCVQS